MLNHRGKKIVKIETVNVDCDNLFLFNFPVKFQFKLINLQFSPRFRKNDLGIKLNVSRRVCGNFSFPSNEVNVENWKQRKLF